MTYINHIATFIAYNVRKHNQAHFETTSHIIQLHGIEKIMKIT